MLNNITIRGGLTLVISVFVVFLLTVIGVGYGALKLANSSLDDSEKLLQVQLALGTYQTLFSVGKQTDDLLPAAHKVLLESNKDFRNYMAGPFASDDERKLAQSVEQTRRRADAQTRRRADAQTRRRADAQTRRRADAQTRRRAPRWSTRRSSRSSRRSPTSTSIPSATSRATPRTVYTRPIRRPSTRSKTRRSPISTSKPSPPRSASSWRRCCSSRSA
ncbi:hypothetical protein LMG28614_01054 [Paraburkholderia ultramafica]|uniref:Chemotaxis methyl-accepting receptor Tar-related ligand-binding domain-containing protein n=1 Tax=Paraburkholderia ultramafica TaxID=1544867 RepID=A0A6S7B502_9BURK|nr:Tar ligand binding domain-containing protein [Paraburkholderia ultramafica]CAB3780606.1 hypothetical protein LMG28614_01054 [Paraburkholderia ultramafica]